MPSRVLGYISPKQQLLSTYPHCLLMSELLFKTFGCTMFVYLQSHNRGKLDKRSLKCMFVGYSGTQKGYKCFHPDSRTIYTTLDVVFDEKTPYYLTNPQLSTQSIDTGNYWSIIDISTVGGSTTGVQSAPVENIMTNEETYDNPSQGEQDAEDRMNTRPPVTQVYSRRRRTIQSLDSSESGHTSPMV